MKIYIIATHQWTIYTLEGNEITDIRSRIAHTTDTLEKAVAFLQKNSAIIGWFEVTETELNTSEFNIKVFDAFGKELEPKDFVTLYENTKAQFKKELEEQKIVPGEAPVLLVPTNK